jgi:hypothetical protein
MAYNFKTHVHIDEREFIVHYGDDGNVLRIYERKTYVHYGVRKTWNACYWFAKSHVLGSGNTMPKRVIAAARYKMVEDATS